MLELTGWAVCRWIVSGRRAGVLGPDFTSGNELQRVQSQVNSPGARARSLAGSQSVMTIVR
jgi:hypothetical protein